MSSKACDFLFDGTQWETTALICLFRFWMPGDLDALGVSDLN
jgi:hypothetical protein